jgi:hypothetical protein
MLGVTRNEPFGLVRENTMNTQQAIHQAVWADIAGHLTLVGQVATDHFSEEATERAVQAATELLGHFDGMPFGACHLTSPAGDRWWLVSDGRFDVLGLAVLHGGTGVGNVASIPSHFNGTPAPVVFRPEVSC